MKQYKREAVTLKAIWSKKQKIYQIRVKNPKHDVVRSKPKGSLATERIRGKYATTVKICSYNIKTLSTEDDLENLLEEADKIEWDIMGLCETYRKGEGLTSIKGGHYLYESGKTEDCPNAKGVALLINS